MAALALLDGAYLASGMLPGVAWSAGGRRHGGGLRRGVVGGGSPVGLLLAAGAALGGTPFEVVLVAAGEFSYAQPDAFGVAGWLPLLYATAGVSLGALGSRLVDGGASPALRSNPLSHPFPG